jgi:hypothetical protein
VSRRSNETDFSRGFAKELRELGLFRCVAPGERKEEAGEGFL